MYLLAAMTSSSSKPYTRQNPEKQIKLRENLVRQWDGWMDDDGQKVKLKSGHKLKIVLKISFSQIRNLLTMNSLRSSLKLH